MDINRLRNMCIGSKFYRYDDDGNADVIRIYRVDEAKKTIKVFDSNGNKKTISLEGLSNYRQLASDAILSFMIVKNEDIPDVVVAMGVPKKDLNAPYAVCRQMISDVFTNNTIRDNETYLGVSISQDTCPANVDFNMVLQCSELKSNRSVNVYMDDTLDDILKLVHTKPFDNVLESLASANRQIGGRYTLGYCHSLKELLNSNNFMYDFRKAFGIMEIPFEVDENSEGLSVENADFLGKELKETIIETYVVKYSKEINLNEIKRNYVLVVSAAEQYKNLYIVGYDKA